MSLALIAAVTFAAVYAVNLSGPVAAVIVSIGFAISGIIVDCVLFGPKVIAVIKKKYLRHYLISNDKLKHAESVTKPSNTIYPETKKDTPNITERLNLDANIVITKEVIQARLERDMLECYDQIKLWRSKLVGLQQLFDAVGSSIGQSNHVSLVTAPPPNDPVSNNERGSMNI